MTAHSGADPGADREPLLVDARGLRCPLPVLRLAQALQRLPEGGRVRLLATDPAARTDVPAFCRLRGLHLADVAPEGDHTAYLVATQTHGAGSGAESASPSSPR